eukprot:scaffold2072_cov162-Amphora_coffeaeformis.AAC.3
MTWLKALLMVLLVCPGSSRYFKDKLSGPLAQNYISYSGDHRSANTTTSFLRKRPLATVTPAPVSSRPADVPADPSSAIGVVRSLVPEILVLRFVVVNVETNEDLFVLRDGQVLDTRSLPDFSIRAETLPSSVGSVSFSLDGVIVKTENFSPYSIAGETSSGYTAWSVSIPKPSLMIVDVAMPPGDRIVQLLLVDTSLGEDLMKLSDGTIIDMSSLPEFTIRAVTQPQDVGSVLFSVDGRIVKIENREPYAIAGDNIRTGDFFLWRVKLGEYNISATPFTETNGEGLEGEALSLSITVV